MRLAVAKDNITMVINAFAVLHNLCKDKGHTLPENPSVAGPLVMVPTGMDILNIDRCHRIMGTLVQDVITDLVGERAPLSVGLYSVPMNVICGICQIKIW